MMHRLGAILHELSEISHRLVPFLFANRVVHQLFHDFEVLKVFLVFFVNWIIRLEIDGFLQGHACLGELSESDLAF